MYEVLYWKHRANHGTTRIYWVCFFTGYPGTFQTTWENFCHFVPLVSNQWGKEDIPRKSHEHPRIVEELSKFWLRIEYSFSHHTSNMNHLCIYYVTIFLRSTYGLVSRSHFFGSISRTVGKLQRWGENPGIPRPIQFPPPAGLTLWWTNIAMENGYL